MRSHSAKPDGCPTSTITNPPDRSSSANPDDILDASTDNGLRAALHLISEHGWHGPAGRAVFSALEPRCAAWAARRAIASGVPRGAIDPGEVLSTAWFKLNSFPDAVSRADAPWAYLWRAVHNCLAVDVMASALLSDRATRLSADARPTGVARMGEGLIPAHRLYTELDGTPHLEVSPAVVSPSVAALVGHLAGEDATESAFWTDAVTRALDVLAGTRRSYEEVALRRDPYLRETLALTLDELAALAALLIGPRRGDRAAHSLLLALHRDPKTQLCDVTGALARVRLLTSRPHTAHGPARPRGVAA